MAQGRAMTLTPADFGDLHARYHRLLFAYFLAQTNDPELAGDLLQATFERAIAAADSYHGENEHELRGWLRAIAYSVMRDHERGDVYDQRVLGRLRSSRPSFSDDELARLQNAAAREAFFSLIARQVDELPAEQARAVRLRFLEDLPYEEIAKRMNTSEQAARTRTSRGLRSLRKRLGKAHTRFRLGSDQ